MQISEGVPLGTMHLRRRQIFTIFGDVEKLSFFLSWPF